MSHVKELSDVAKFAVEVAVAVKKAGVDGFGLSDLPLLFGLIQPGFQAIEGIGNVVAEFEALDADGKAEFEAVVCEGLAPEFGEQTTSIAKVAIEVVIVALKLVLKVKAV